MAGEWIECALADACSSIDYGLTASASDDETGPRFLRITDVVSGHIDWNAVPHVAAGAETAEKYRLHDGDVVLARTGASTGASAYVKDPPPAVFASYLVRLKARPDFDSRFLAYYLKSDDFWTFIRGVLGDKSAQPNASASTMTKAPLRAPRDKSEQRAIAHILGTLDDKIELNRKQNETLEAMARALFKAWFVDFEPVRAKMEGRWVRGQSLPGLPAHLFDLFPDKLVESELGDIPEGWGVKKIEDVITRLSVGKKYEQKTVLPKGIVPVLDQGKSGVIGFHNDTPSVVATSESPVVVFANHTCYMRLINFPFSAIQNVLPFIGKELPTIWVYFATIGKQSFVEYKGHWPDFVIHELAVPAENLAKDFAKITSTYLKQIWENERESLSLTQLRDTLLPKLISGELRVPAAMVEGII